MMAAESDASKKMITLKSSDGEEFEVEEAIVMESRTIRHMIEDGCTDNKIPLPNVNSKILSMVIEYCQKHVYATANPTDDANFVAKNRSTAALDMDLKIWDTNFIMVNQATLTELTKV